MNIIKKIQARLAKSSPTEEAFVVDPGSFDPQSEKFIQNPYPMLAQLRRSSPIARLQNGNWVLTRYQDIAFALATPAFLNSPSPYAVLNARNNNRYTSASVANHILPFLDPPQHTGIRSVMAEALVARVNKAALQWHPKIDSLLRTDTGQLDLLGDFATPLCADLVSQLFGVELSASDTRRLKDWSQWFFYLFSIIPDENTLDALNMEMTRFRDFIAGLIAEDPSADGFFQALSGAATITQPISRQQLLDNCLLLVADAINADYGIANVLYTLLTNPQFLQELRKNPQLMTKAVSELLRYESPSLFIARRAAEDIEVDGQLIRKNAGVLLFLASANRDDSVFERASELVPGRDRNPYLTFGKGAHSCLGKQLVHRLIKSLLEYLVDNIAEMELLDKRQVHWESRAGHRWLSSLPARVRLK